MTNAIKTIRPMLASKVENVKVNFKERVVIQPKLDGIRCVISKEGAFTRNGKELLNIEHILKDLTQFFEFHPDYILDGELYNHELKDDFNKIISLCRKQKPTEADKEASKGLIQFHWYDIINEEKQRERDARRKQLFEFFFDDNSSVKFVHSFVVKSKRAVDMIHKEFKDDGYEGSMLRLNHQYKVGKRSKSLLKVKDWQDTEATITGWIEGKGKFKEGLGKWLGVDETGRKVEVPWPSLTIPQRQWYWENKEKFLGSLVTFEYFQRTPAGAYRFPRAKCIRNYE